MRESPCARIASTTVRTAPSSMTRTGSSPPSRRPEKRAASSGVARRKLPATVRKLRTFMPQGSALSRMTSGRNAPGSMKSDPPAL